MAPYLKKLKSITVPYLKKTTKTRHCQWTMSKKSMVLSCIIITMVLSKHITIVLWSLLIVFPFPISVCPALCVVMDVRSHWGLEEISCLCSVWLPQESQPAPPTQTRAAAPRAPMLRRYCAVNGSHGVTQTSADSRAAMNDETGANQGQQLCDCLECWRLGGQRLYSLQNRLIQLIWHSYRLAVHMGTARNIG